ncbi:MAG: chemotaxis protein CheA [Deltaproteobacteria bacterium HGW-Deltaproteobacteria-21]|nr:MAG: chemotaxis protein CheA [Deltaproteobacteria bacterium HGW-Deltaproteobacteria-21]
MTEWLERLEKGVEGIALEIVTLDKGDIPALGNIMNSLCRLEEDGQESGQSVLQELIKALKSYLERLVLAEADDLNPLEEATGMLQSMVRTFRNGEVFQGDLSQLFHQLSYGGEGDRGGGSGAEGAQKSSAAAMSEEDRQIISDFVIESLENLGTIEVNLINLEQDPSDQETVNAIFRPFHTIKGVSGFLNLTKINRLAHNAENLLDKARNRELRVEGMVIDIILETVDTLKRMIEGVRESLEQGSSLDSGIDIGPLSDRIETILSESDLLGEKPLGEILIHKGAVDRQDVEQGLTRQKEEPEKRIGEILVEENKAETKDVISALRDQKKFSRQHIDLQVKVDTKKLDNLVDLTGELVINQAMLRQNKWVLSSKDQKLYHNLNQLNQITSSLQRTAMSMRMVPIRSTFQKMVRLVRDLSKNSGKEVVLEMEGEDTEIDRNVVEELYEPMVHMIRNAVDHGIELPEDREKSGKRRNGTVFLKAYHRGGHIIIEIRDDGRGLDRERILEKARSLQLIADESKMVDSDIYNLIFHPGFSTAEKVTDISGRGVGMDVVRKGIDRLRGRIEINSIKGEGAVFVISLPLTLAIIEGMVVRVGKERYIIPALTILESFRPEKKQYSTIEGKGEMILTRGRLVPLVRLDRMFGIQGDYTHPWEGLVVAVENDGHQRCLLLDELVGKEEVVIKSLGQGLKAVRGIAGGAILGDGRVGLILDISGIFEISQN